MSSPKNTSHQKLMEAVQKAAPPQSKTSTPEYMRRLAYIPDRALASRLVIEQAELEFDTDQGKDIPCLESELKECDTMHAASRKTLQTLESQLAGTNALIRSPTCEARITFLHKDRSDQISLVLLSACLVLMLVMGSANTYSNIMASGEIVYLEQPWLAWCIAALVPAASTVFKYVSHFFDYEKTKKRYAVVVYVLTIISVCAWAVLFAHTFNGVASTLDWNTFSSSDGGKGSAMVILQMASEVLIAAALFLAIEGINIKYNPNVLKNNPDYAEITKALNKHKADHDQISQKRNAAHTELTRLKNERQKFLLHRSTEFASLIMSQTV